MKQENLPDGRRTLAEVFSGRALPDSQSEFLDPSEIHSMGVLAQVAAQGGFG